MEAYIMEPDVIGLRTIQLLKEAVLRGVEVTLMYDSWGCSK